MSIFADHLYRMWWLMGLALLGLALSGCEEVPTLPAKRDALYPKIVLQTLPTNGIELAAWTPDDKHIVTAVGQTRTVAIWDAATGHIVDRLTLPADASENGVVRRLRSMEVSQDGKIVTIDAETSSFEDNEFSEPRVRRYLLDMQTRDITLVDAPEGLEVTWSGDDIEEVTEALEILYEDRDAEDRAPEWVDQMLLPLPDSHDGKWQLRRLAKPVDFNEDGSPSEGGLEIVPASGEGPIRRFVHPPMVKFAGADLSPDALRFATLDDKKIYYEEDASDLTTVIDIFDIEAAEFLHQIELEGDYGTIQWLDDVAILVAAETRSWDRNEEFVDAELPDAVVVDTEDGSTIRRIPGRCFMLAGPKGSFFGSNSASCVPSDTSGFGDSNLERFDPVTGRWQRFSELELDGESVIEKLAISRDGTKIAVAVIHQEDENSYYLIDVETGKVLQSLESDETDWISQMQFDAKGERLLTSVGRGIEVWDLADNSVTLLPLETLDTSIIENNGSLIAVGGLADDSITLFDLAADREVATLDYGNITAGGFVPGKPLFWAFSEGSGIRIWDTRDWSELLTSYFFYGQGFMAVTPDGRYDSNIHPYKAQFRWLVPDEPYQSLNSDAFSRDYYTPGVGYRWLACSIERDCDDAFAPIKSITELNRTLPKVRIRKVKASPDAPDKAIVTLEITEGVNPDAQNGKTRSGIFDPRMLRDHQLVFDYGADSSAAHGDLNDWRESQQLSSENGTVVQRTVISLPTDLDEIDEEGIIISAYAFNEDRIKGETSETRFVPPDVEPRERRAYIVSIGIDHYQEERLNLSYAGADAMLMQTRLGGIPGYETRRLAIASGGSDAGDEAENRPEYVSKDTVLAVLGLLAGRNRTAMLERLERQGIDASMLEQATPDDLVIISYSGHGWADKRGQFFIVPSEASWSEGETKPQKSSLLSSLELAAALQGIDAGEMALIIDACHSAASVADGSFKPGPLGDPGLGQLAFDKGVRVLSATQADDVALEDSGLRQGLLTFALAGEALQTRMADADDDEDGQIDLGEWLNYAVWRLPQLSEAVGNEAPQAEAVTQTRALVFLDQPQPRTRTRLQKPSLFDFNIEPSRTVLRGSAQ